MWPGYDAIYETDGDGCGRMLCLQKRPQTFTVIGVRIEELWLVDYDSIGLIGFVIESFGMLVPIRESFRRRFWPPQTRSNIVY